jgi:hypothetical protein
MSESFLIVIMTLWFFREQCFVRVIRFTLLRCRKEVCDVFAWNGWTWNIFLGIFSLLENSSWDFWMNSKFGIRTWSLSIKNCFTTSLLPEFWIFDRIWTHTITVFTKSWSKLFNLLLNHSGTDAYLSHLQNRLHIAHYNTQKKFTSTHSFCLKVTHSPFPTTSNFHIRIN